MDNSETNKVSVGTTVYVGYEDFIECGICGSHGGYPEIVFLDKDKAEEWEKGIGSHGSHSRIISKLVVK